MPLSEVDKARLVDGGVEISLVLPSAVKGSEYVISAVVTQNATVGQGQRAIAHGTFLFSPAQDNEPAVFTVPVDAAGGSFDAKVGIEVRASATYSCWSSLDGASGDLVAQGWTWQLGDWG
jgi:hypothetical protein